MATSPTRIMVERMKRARVRMAGSPEVMGGAVLHGVPRGQRDARHGTRRIVIARAQRRGERGYGLIYPTATNTTFVVSLWRGHASISHRAPRGRSYTPRGVGYTSPLGVTRAHPVRIEIKVFRPAPVGTLS
jgi:hypothetical protein